MTEGTTTQLGLTFVFAAVAGLMALLQHVEKSSSIRLWMFSFLFFACDAAVSAARHAYDLSPKIGILAWCFLASGAIAGLFGTLSFLGKKPSKRVYVFSVSTVFLLILAILLKIPADILRPIIFCTIGVVFAWTGITAYREGIVGGAGRWVAASAFFAAATYAILWPLLYQLPIMLKLEFFLDLTILLWAANGVLLMHFDRSRHRLRELAAQELALKEKLAQSERVDALGRLAAGLAHDFNNVLTIVINGSDLVLKQLQDQPDIADKLLTVRQAAEGAVGFTKQLLALGRRRLPGRKPTLVSDALSRALRIIVPSLPSNTNLDIKSTPETLVVNAAEGQLEQLFINLAINAADAMPDGGHLKIEVSTKQNESKALLVIKDTGIGMDETIIARVFDPFFTTRDASGGTGLGLAAVYAIVQQLGGDINVQSKVGHGTVFTIELPLYLSTIERKTIESEQFKPSAIKILVVDDYKTVTHTVTESLRSVGFNVSGSCDPLEALKIAASDPPDILLSDVCMPTMSGPELADQIKKSCPNIKVIFMTGIAQEPDAELQKEGAIWIVKPVDVKSIINAAQTLLDQRQSEIPVRQ